jgi:hypothetical protein
MSHNKSITKGITYNEQNKLTSTLIKINISCEVQWLWICLINSLQHSDCQLWLIVATADMMCIGYVYHFFEERTKEARWRESIWKIAYWKGRTRTVKIREHIRVGYSESRDKQYTPTWSKTKQWTKQGHISNMISLSRIVNRVLVPVLYPGKSAKTIFDDH